MIEDDTWMPGEYAVYVIHPPHLKQWKRVGLYRSVKDAKKGILSDLDAMGNPLGGLIPGLPLKGRRYRLFKATWEELHGPRKG